MARLTVLRVSRHVLHFTPWQTLHFTPWQTCSFPHIFDLCWKHSASLRLLREDSSITYPPLSVARYSFIQLNELKQCGVNEIVNISKRLQEYSKPSSLDWSSHVVTTAPPRPADSYFTTKGKATTTKKNTWHTKGKLYTSSSQSFFSIEFPQRL